MIHRDHKVSRMRSLGEARCIVLHHDRVLDIVDISARTGRICFGAGSRRHNVRTIGSQ